MGFEVSWNVKVTDLIIATSFVFTAITGAVSVFRLIKKSKEHKQKILDQASQIDSLIQIANSQNSISEKLGGQLSEMEKQTNENFKQTTLMIDSNKNAYDLLQLEINKDKRELAKENEELREYYLYLIKNFKLAVEAQINAFNKYAEELYERKMRNFILVSDSSFTTPNLEHISQPDLYRLFVTNRKGLSNEKIRKFQNLSDSIEAIKQIKRDFPLELEKLDERINRYSSEWRKNITVIQREFEILLQAEIEKKNFEDPFLKEFDQIFASWIKMETENFKDVYVAIEYFIEPIRILCNNYTSDDPRSMKFLPYLLGCKYAFENIDHIKKYYGDYFKNTASNLNISYEKIESFVNDFQEKTE